jgi:hypothetical protein
VILLVRHFDEIESLKVLDIIIFKFIELIMIFLMIFEPELHHRRSLTTFLVKLPPAPRPFSLLEDDVVLSDWLILPFE